jgi:hypothetical protein
MPKTENLGIRREQPPVPVLKLDKLKDQLTLALVDLEGGPVPLKLIIKKLWDRGWVIKDSAAVMCMQRNRDRFSNDSHGHYSLRLARNGDAEES